MEGGAGVRGVLGFGGSVSGSAEKNMFGVSALDLGFSLALGACPSIAPGDKIQHKIPCSERRPFVLKPTGIQHKTFGFAYVTRKIECPRFLLQHRQNQRFCVESQWVSTQMAAVSNKRFCVEFIGLGVFLGTGFTSSCRGLCVESQDVRTTQVLC